MTLLSLLAVYKKEAQIVSLWAYLPNTFDTLFVPCFGVPNFWEILSMLGYTTFRSFAVLIKLWPQEFRENVPLQTASWLGVQGNKVRM